jgi:DNA-binding transcriptional regulator YiaG
MRQERYEALDVYHLRKILLEETQAQFAQRIGVTTAAVSRWENGRSIPARMAQRALVRERQEYDRLHDKKTTLDKF